MHAGQLSICRVIVDAVRSRSTCLGREAYIHDHCREYVITMYFSISRPTVSSSPAVRYVFEREASSENYGPRVYFNHIIKTKNTLLQFNYFCFTLIFIYLSLS